MFSKEDFKPNKLISTQKSVHFSKSPEEMAPIKERNSRLGRSVVVLPKIKKRIPEKLSMPKIVKS